MVTHSFRIVPTNAPQEPIIVNFDPCKEKLIMLLCNKINVRMQIKQNNQDSFTMISYLDILKFLGSFSVAQNVHNHLHNRLILSQLVTFYFSTELTFAMETVCCSITS